MKLDKKKELAARAFKIGKNRILFNIKRLDEIKEAITKQDMRDLYSQGAISIREIKGRRKIEKRKTRRMLGSRKKYIKDKKRNYIILTRKFRNYLFSLKNQGKLSQDNFLRLRKEIRASVFKSLAQLKERLKETKWKNKED